MGVGLLGLGGAEETAYVDIVGLKCLVFVYALFRRPDNNSQLEFIIWWWMNPKRRIA